MQNQSHLLIRPVTDESSKAWKEVLNNNSSLEHKIALVALEVDAMKDPEDALSARIASTTGEVQQTFINHLRKWEQSNYSSIVREAALKTGADPDQIVNPETRTEEQQHALIEASARRQIERMDMFFNSDYMQAANALDAVKSVFDDISYSEEKIDIKQEFLLYYFSTHPDIRPSTTGKFDASDKEDLIDQYKKFESFLIGYFKDAEKAAHASTDDFIKALHAFVEKEDPAAAERITEITQADFFGLPLSKIWSSQGVISAEGAEGREINVGKKTESGRVIVQASISGKNGEPLTLDEVQKGVQRAIGNLVYEAGGKSVLPIIITPQQIYRAFARLPRDATVTESQAAEMERAMDVLMYAPVNLNFTAQLERHKHIKQVDDYDYQGEQAGKLGGTLVPAQKMEAENRNGLRNVAYKIYDVPVLYMYSRAVNQLAWVPNTLLTGAGKNPVKTGNVSDAQGTARSVAVKENVLARVYRMLERQKRKEMYTPVIRVDDVAEDCGIMLTEKTRRTLRKNIGLYLQELQTQKKIKGYQEQKAGRGIIGYTVKP